MNTKKILVAGVLLYLLISARRRKSTAGEYVVEKEINLAFAPDQENDGAIVMTLWKASEPAEIIQQFLVFDQDTEIQTDTIDGDQYTAGFDHDRQLYFLTIASPGDDNTPPETVTMFIDRFGSWVESM